LSNIIISLNRRLKSSERCLLLITKHEITQTRGILSNQTLIVVPPVEFW